MTAEGKPVEAPREKSFIEKYWVYMVIALVAMSKCIALLLHMMLSQLLTRYLPQRSPRPQQKRERAKDKARAAGSDAFV